MSLADSRVCLRMEKLPLFHRHADGGFEGDAKRCAGCGQDRWRWSFGRLGAMLKTILPAAAPALAAVTIYVFIVAWNHF